MELVVSFLEAVEQIVETVGASMISLQQLAQVQGCRK